MKFAKKMSLLLTLVTAALGTAYAVDAQAKFTLPQATRVGESVLPAGAYTFTMSLDGTTKAFITPVDRSGETVIVVPVSTDSYATCEESSLKMQRTGTVWNVSSVCFAQSQTALYFSIPAQKAAAAPAHPEAAMIAAPAK